LESLDPLVLHAEAIIFCAAEPVSSEEIRQGLCEKFETEIQEDQLSKALQFLREKYLQDGYSFSLEENSGGYHFLTKPAFQSSVAIVWKQKVKKRLSPAALETLSIIAYKQPVTKPDIEKIRGVNCDYAVQKLLEKELISIAGKSSLPGKPVLYATSRKFMDYFGINSLDDLPELREIVPEENSVGEAVD
jgi:segregation and condensation protein B